MLNGSINENVRLFKQEINIYFKATKTNKEDNDRRVAKLLNLMKYNALQMYNTLNILETVAVEKEKTLKQFEDTCFLKTEAMTFYKFLPGINQLMKLLIIS